jgi:hypothetical protein
MTKYNPFFEKAGMILAGKMELQPDQKKLLELIENVSHFHNKALCKAFLNNLNSEQIGQLQHLLEQNIKAVGGASPGRMEQLQRSLREGNFSETLVNCLPVQRYYLCWVNPEFQQTQLKTDSGQS